MADSHELGLRLALYARVSTEEQREGQNIDSQISELERFSREKGWPVVETYKDDGWSGGVMERPELDRLRDDALKGMFDAVLINDVDRLARDVAHLGVIKRDLEKKGVRVIFRKLPAETSPTYNLMVNILGSFAEFEREMISDRTRRGRRHKIEARKQYLGGNTAYGYRYLPKNRLVGTDGILELNPREAPVVAQMFAWVDEEGLSARRVMLRLTELGIAPKKGAGRWAKSSVLRILHCETYAGVWHYNKFQSCEPKDPSAAPRYRKHSKSSLRMRPRIEWLPLKLPEHLRIVSRDRWTRVQNRLRQNITFSPRNEIHSYLLKGLVRCGACGSRYVGDPCHGRFYYRCIARCKMEPSIAEHLLNETVIGAVRKAMLKPEVILAPLKQLQNAEVRERRERARAAKSAAAVLTRLKVEEERVLEAYRLGVTTPAQLGLQLEAIKAQRTNAGISVGEAEQQDVKLDGNDANIALSDYCAEAARNIANFSQERWREFLRTIIHTVIFRGSMITIQGRIPIRGTGATLRLETPVLGKLDGLRPSE